MIGALKSRPIVHAPIAHALPCETPDFHACAHSIRPAHRDSRRATSRAAGTQDQAVAPGLQRDGGFEEHLRAAANRLLKHAKRQLQWSRDASQECGARSRWRNGGPEGVVRRCARCDRFPCFKQCICTIWGAVPELGGDALEFSLPAGLSCVHIPATAAEQIGKAAKLRVIVGRKGKPDAGMPCASA